MQLKEIEQLLEKYNKGEATPAENALIESWYLTYRNDAPRASHQQLEEDQEDSLNKLLFQINSTTKRSYTRAFAIAASLLVFVTAGVLMFMHHQAKKQQFMAAAKPVKNDLPPGGNKAILTLANGSTVVLTDAKNGKLASQGGVVVSKTADGQIKYAGSGQSISSNTLVYNTATTPKGGQYQFILSDGTKVWLNSASSIKYPVNFIGNERRVELTGEAYFEVAHNAAKPFRVVSSGQTVEVLGTHFNINAYADESAVKTTLLQGSVKVSSADGSSVIKPGEQAQFNNGKINVVSGVDLDAAVAWKNGLFYFEDSNIQEVMRQFARWYDVDVKYEGELSARHFAGEIPRNINATQMLDILSFKKIHYKLQGKTIIVMP
ncbi:FecR family protein [Mucilaginibacter sp. X5P1]|uniref:FecR family protein n=1 Tax=Mucilaginibacter sp. X5P1 TaxID=2723088 RepID=UPI00160D83F0|nr:FecR family protein [Mucilaginibacter sp. X5P1]MBB6140957.1 ferric-dicitrate binding protein FerR (iron transport regulator) [Mucilaginibacter sp. X5P1]